MLDNATISAICNEANKHGKIVTMHHERIAEFEKGIECGVSSFEHMPLDADLTEEQIKAFLNSGASIVPTITAIAFLLLPLDPQGDSTETGTQIKRDNRY